MILAPIFDLYVNKSPLSVMARATVQHALSASELDKPFNEHAELGYCTFREFITSGGEQEQAFGEGF